MSLSVYKKGTLSLWSPIGLWDFEAPTFSLENRFTDGGEFVSLTRRQHFPPPGRFLVLISVRGWVDPRAIVRLEGLGKLKRSTSSVLEPATFRDSAVGIETGYGLDCREVSVRVPVESRNFSSPRPDRLWGPPKILSNAYRELFPQG
jgi:hypothetical protein